MWHIFKKHRGPGPPDLRAVAHRLRTIGLALRVKHMDKCKLYEFFAFELITGQFDDLQNFFQYPWTLAIYTFFFFFFVFRLISIRGRHSRYLYFCNMAFVLRSDALPATNPLIGGKTGPPACHIKVGRPVKCLAQRHNKRTCRLVLHNLP